MIGVGVGVGVGVRSLGDTCLGATTDGCGGVAVAESRGAGMVVVFSPEGMGVFTASTDFVDASAGLFAAVASFEADAGFRVAGTSFVIVADFVAGGFSATFSGIS